MAEACEGRMIQEIAEAALDRQVTAQTYTQWPRLFRHCLAACERREEGGRQADLESMERKIANRNATD